VAKLVKVDAENIVFHINGQTIFKLKL